MSAVVAAVATVGVGVVGAYTARSEGSKNRAAADRAGDLQAEISGRELDLAEDQWEIYEEQILPLELEAQELGIDAQELAQRRGETEFNVYNDYYRPLQESYAQDAQDGIEGQYDRVARDAADTVDQQYDRDQKMTERALERKGVRPDSGNYKANEQQISFSRAANRANSMNIARENEKDRVEDTNFNRKSVALGRSPVGSAATQSPGRPSVNPSSATSLLNSAASGYGQTANRYTSLANQSSASAASALSGGITAGANIYSAFRPQPVNSQFTYEQANNFQGDIPGGPIPFADGGPVLTRGNPGGEVNGPEGYDKVPAKIDSPDGNTYDARLTDGEYVIPVDVVMAKGTDFFDGLLAKHHKPSSPKALSRRTH